MVKPPAAFDYAETFGAVFAHAGHENADGGERKFLRDGVEENVDGRAMTVHGRAVGKNRHVAAWHAANHHVAIARADEHATGEEQVTRTLLR